MIATETPACIFSVKIVTHIFDAEIFTCISVVETSNCVIATETVTFITATKRSTNISVAESTTNIITIEPQNLYNWSRRWHLHNCYRKCQLHSSNRNCHLQNWLQKLSLAEMVPVRNRFSYNKEIEWMSLRQNSFSITCIIQWRNSTALYQWIVLYIHCFIFLSSFILQTKKHYNIAYLKS